MSPPPPPLARGRKRSGHTFDAALDDAELAAARTALSQGRWQAVRSLLARTGDDWDRRGHRVTVLAAEPYCAAWTRDWLLAEPDSGDASVLLALAQVRLALRGKEKPPRARDACHRAAALLPADPTPWLGLLELESALGTEPDLWRCFTEVRARYADHHHAHHLVVARLAEQRSAAGVDPMHAVYDFALDAAQRAPADSPLAVLPVVAHTERFRVLAAAGHEPRDAAASGHWAGRRARQVMRSAFDWWLEWEQEGHPRRLIDLNFLAHAKVCEGRGAEAAALFHRIGDHATPSPWSYPDRDPYPAFRAARDTALGTA
ncbi:hypothetical protein [Streptomyces sp. NPDC059805]|uniref:hypothetical protein n=1 Tax=Streptomyces sp. NPDC059805 TaxID=3346954 RepID=UPI003656881A